MKYVKLAFLKPYIDLMFINTFAWQYSVISAWSSWTTKGHYYPIKFKWNIIYVRLAIMRGASLLSLNATFAKMEVLYITLSLLILFVSDENYEKSFAYIKTHLYITVLKWKQCKT